MYINTHVLPFFHPICSDVSKHHRADICPGGQRLPQVPLQGQEVGVEWPVRHPVVPVPLSLRVRSWSRCFCRIVFAFCLCLLRNKKVFLMSGGVRSFPPPCFRESVVFLVLVWGAGPVGNSAVCRLGALLCDVDFFHLRGNIQSRTLPRSCLFVQDCGPSLLRCTSSCRGVFIRQTTQYTCINASSGTGLVKTRKTAVKKHRGDPKQDKAQASNNGRA